ncbi:hypothetical protein L2E82_02312 [Cichorium intybus]|uniref:Uncharacterized protein n=1 Tax=Cichorium intybus TaxID=13427 RepID=A0ACB9H2F4_CICIN|nr:hypothetical protein L2E82_02312 [Cichorium intybus]
MNPLGMALPYTPVEHVSDPSNTGELCSFLTTNEQSTQSKSYQIQKSRQLVSTTPISQILIPGVFLIVLRS